MRSEQAELRFAPRRDRAGAASRVVGVAADASQPLHEAALRDAGRRAINPAAAGDRQRDTGPSR